VTAGISCGCHLGQQLGEVLKQIGEVEVAVVVDVQLGDEAGNPPQLHQSLQSHLLHLVGHLDVLRRDDVHQLLQVHLSCSARVARRIY